MGPGARERRSARRAKYRAIANLIASIMFKDPKTKLPSDGERIQFKVFGDPAITGVEEPTLGRFYTPESTNTNPNFLGTFVNEATGYGYHVWATNQHEVEGWRPIAEFHSELH